MRSSSKSRFVFAFVCLCALLGANAVCVAQQASPTPPKSSERPDSSEFAAAADEVLGEMSQITGLKLRTPLKKTLRSREEIRAYVIKEMDDEKGPKERYSSARSAEAFGLIPKNFDFDTFMVDLLTEQIAGLYDPKTHEFYVADWIPLSDQRMVMAHELTHALEDQHFNIEPWVKAARPNDDAELAREAVLEGSATAAMIDYLLKDTGRTLKDLPEFDPSLFLGNLSDTPTLAKAPPFLKDALLFPYLNGLQFSAAALKRGGWPALPGMFEKPPASTQQILHPELYRLGQKPAEIHEPEIGKLLGAGWNTLDSNVLGEFGWREVLKQFLDAERAKPIAAEWRGDHYTVYEHKATKKLVLAARLKLSSEESAARFFGQYSEALEKKHAQRMNLMRRPNFFSFETPEGSVFLRCFGSECITLEGTDRALFDAFNKAMAWPAAPEQPLDAAKPVEKTARLTGANALAAF